MIKISAIICSYDRPELLRDAIASLAKQDLAHDLFEIVVIDNSEKMHFSEEVLKERFPRVNLKYVFKPCIGLSAARNLGTEISVGDTIAFLDDDATATQSWLSELLSCFSEDPSIAVVGGKVVPNWSSPPPDWLMGDLNGKDPRVLLNHQRPMIGNLSIINWGDETRPLNSSEWLAGVNIAFRKKALIDSGGFDEHLGRTSAAHILLSNEEKAVLQRIETSGAKILYHPKAVVAHLIPSERLEQKWFVQRVAWQVISDILTEKKELNADEIKESLSVVGTHVSMDQLLAPDLSKEQFDKKIFTLVALLKLILHGHDLSELSDCRKQESI